MVRNILDELRRNLLRYGIAKSGVDYRIGQMVDHFPGAMVIGHHSLVKSMTNHPKDRHVLGAAVRGRAIKRILSGVGVTRVVTRIRVQPCRRGYLNDHCRR
jgi:hypothetical protein